MIFKNRLRSLTSKRLVCLLEFFLKSVDSSAISSCFSTFRIKSLTNFFGLIEDNLKKVHLFFQTIFKTSLKDKEKILNSLQLHYSNAKLEVTNNLIKLIKRNTFGFRNFENFKKRIFIALNIKKERTKFVLSRS